MIVEYIERFEYYYDLAINIFQTPILSSLFWPSPMWNAECAACQSSSQAGCWQHGQWSPPKASCAQGLLFAYYIPLNCMSVILQRISQVRWCLASRKMKLFLCPKWRVMIVLKHVHWQLSTHIQLWVCIYCYYFCTTVNF